jgi:hypothetical protein
MKHIKSALIIVALFTALSTDAKQIGKKAETTPSPIITPQAPNINQPYIQPEPRSKPIIMPKTETGPTYSDIYSSLKKKTPDSSDFSTLNNIIYEAQRQLDLIRASVKREPTPTSKEALLQLERSIKELFKKYPINLYKTQTEIDNAAGTGKDLFTPEEQYKIVEAIDNVVRELTKEFSTIDSQVIYDTIIAFHPGLKELKNKLIGEQYENITDFIRHAVQTSYSQLKK